jgi:DNA-nicking Smr family endonuclease
MSKNNKNSTNPEDIKAWEDFKHQKFLDGDKGEISKKSIKINQKQDHIDFKIDLHGYSLQESFEKIKSVIENCYQKDLRNILIITGKGLRSKVKENPYLSEDLSLLKYAIPNFIKDNF